MQQGHMKKLLCGLAALPFLAGIALADQPVQLNDKQMDKVTAGFTDFETIRSNTSWTQVSIYSADLTECPACYIDATDLPVSADLEKGFGDAPEIVAETIRLAAEAGLVGCSIEDASGNQGAPIFELRLATERIAAAAAAARVVPFPFTLTGRTENFLRGRPDLDDTIKRLKAYEAAGADALMAPGLPDLDSVRAVCAAVEKPFNFMVGIKGKSFTVAALTAAGVKRISLATSLYRAAMTGLLNAAKEVQEHGTFGYIDSSLATPEMNAFLRE
jgi:2-methylisocitrate lyase-like PEP mutase family enzyme